VPWRFGKPKQLIVQRVFFDKNRLENKVIDFYNAELIPRKKALTKKVKN